MRVSAFIGIFFACGPWGLAAEPTGDALRWQPLNEPGSGGWFTSFAISPHDTRRIIMGGDVLGIGFSDDRGLSWQVSSGLRSGEVADVTWHPAEPLTAWAGTMSGPYVTTDGGRTWHERRRGMPVISEGSYSAPIEVVLFDPHNVRRLLAFGGSNRRMTSLGQPAWGAVWESTDAGESWAKLATITVNGKGRNIVGAAFQPGSSTTLYAAVDQAGLFISTNGGMDWAARNEGLPHTNIEKVAVHPREPEAVWVVLGNHRPEGAKTPLPGGVFKRQRADAPLVSLGKGLNSSTHANENFTARYKGFAIGAADPRVMLLGETTWNHPCVWRSDDGGASWRVVAKEKKVGILETAYPGGPAATVCAIDPKEPAVCYAGGAEYMLRSLDGGKTWTDLTAEKVGDRAWRGRGFSGLCSIGVTFNPRKPGHVVLNAMDAGKLWESTDGMKSWGFQGHDPWPWGGASATVFAGDTHIHSTMGQFGSHGCILRTTDGKTWQALRGEKRGLPPYEGAGIATGIHALPDEPRRVWAVVAGRLHSSEDAGESWRVIHSSSNLGWIAADPTRPCRFFVSSATGVLATKDGKEFTPIAGPKVAGRMACDHQGRLYLAAYRGQRGGVWRYAGGAWERLSADPMIANIAVAPTDPDRLAAITNDDPWHDVCRSTGVWISGDAGKSWTQTSDGLGLPRGHAIAFNPFDSEQLVCGTQGRGYFVARWPKNFVPKPEQRYAHTPDDAKYAAEIPARPQLKSVADLFHNGSMSEGEGLPTGWEGKWGEATVARDTVVFKKAPAALRVASTAGKSGQGFQTVAAGGPRRLKFSGFAKSQGRVKVNVAVQSFNSDYSRNQFDQVKYLQGDHDWTEFSKDVEIPDWAARFNLLLLVEGAGQAWLDEVTIQESPSPRP